MAPFRFGIVAAQASSGAQWKGLATRAEAAGYSSLLMPDGSGPVLAPFSALAAAAAVTTQLKVGNWVMPADFRNPVLVAREAATLAMLSDNRLELGFGGGRPDNDYAALGLPEPASGGERLKHLVEVIEIIKRLFSGNTVTLHGKFHTVRNAILYPKLSAPVPILMAAGGPKAVKIAGQYADVVALAAGSREHFLQQVQTLKAAAGQRFAQIELASIAWLMPEGDAAAAEQARARIRMLSNSDVETLQANQAPTVLAGSRESMLEQLQERREALGLSYVVVGAQSLDWFAPVVQRLSGS